MQRRGPARVEKCARPLAIAFYIARHDGTQRTRSPVSALEERAGARQVDYGVSLRPVEMRLVERAREYLRGGAATSVALIGHVCQLPSPPLFVAEHMAVALLGGFPEFVREGDGSWRHITPESESAIVIGESLRNAPPSSQAAAATSAAATGSASAISAGTRTRPLPTAFVPPQPRDECDNPFTVDARGIRHPKPQCFKK